MGGERKELNRGTGSVVDSNFLCSEYDGRSDQETNEIDSWERDHSWNTGNFTADGKYLGEVYTFVIHVIQGIPVAGYSEQRRPKGECFQNATCGVVSKDTIVVRSHGFLGSPRK